MTTSEWRLALCEKTLREHIALMLTDSVVDHTSQVALWSRFVAQWRAAVEEEERKEEACPKT